MAADESDATSTPVDHLERARAARALVDRLADERKANPVKFMANGIDVGETQRTHLFAAAVDALIDIAESLRPMAAIAREEGGPLCHACGRGNLKDGETG
jgi:hypothetical protein